MESGELHQTPEGSYTYREKESNNQFPSPQRGLIKNPGVTGRGKGWGNYLATNL